MIQLPEERRPPISPAMALRVAVLGGLALVLFAVVFFRLWYLEVLSGDQYVVDMLRDATVKRFDPPLRRRAGSALKSPGDWVDLVVVVVSRARSIVGRWTIVSPRRNVVSGGLSVEPRAWCAAKAVA